ncbi:hypothetical protein ACTFIZ_012298 [Dictyostelium cf. discoideum]
MDLLFYKVYRNQYLRVKIFDEIKKGNILLKYSTYNYYDITLDVIINLNNQNLLLEKVKDHIKHQDDSSSEQLAKYLFDIDIKKLIKWKELDFEIFKLVLTMKSVRSFILGRKLRDLMDYYELIVIKNGKNLEMLKLFLNDFIFPTLNREIEKTIKDRERKWEQEEKERQQMENVPLHLQHQLCQYKLHLQQQQQQQKKQIYEPPSYFANFEVNENFNYPKFWGQKLLTSVYGFAQNFGSTMSMEMFEYLFAIEGYSTGVDAQELRSLFIKIAFYYLDNCIDGEMSNYDLLVSTVFFCLTQFNPSEFSELINKSIELNCLTMVKYIISMFSIENPDEISETNKEIAFIFGYYIPIKTVRQFGIDINKFNSNDTLFSFYQFLIESVFVDENYFTNNQIGSIRVRGPKYFEYAMELLKTNGVPLSQINKSVIFSYECIEDTNSMLLSKEFMQKDYYKSRVLNDDIDIFKRYLLKFAFNYERLFEIINLGYENMVVHVLNKTIENLPFDADGLLSREDRILFFEVLREAITIDKDENWKQYLFDLILPTINRIFSAKTFFPGELCELIGPITEPPRDRIKRASFLSNLSRISNFNEKRNLGLRQALSLNEQLSKRSINFLAGDPEFQGDFCSYIHLVCQFVLYGHLNFAKELMNKVRRISETDRLISVAEVEQTMTTLVNMNRIKRLVFFLTNLFRFRVPLNETVDSFNNVCENSTNKKMFTDLIFGVGDYQNVNIMKDILTSNEELANYPFSYQNDDFVKSILNWRDHYLFCTGSKGPPITIDFQTDGEKLNALVEKILMLLKLKISTTSDPKSFRYLTKLSKHDKLSLSKNSIDCKTFIRKVATNCNHPVLISFGLNTANLKMMKPLLVRYFGLQSLERFFKDSC